MPRSATAAIVLLLSAGPGIALAQSLGTVTSANRAQLSTTDANGTPLGPVKAADLKLPQPIVALGKGNSIGIRQGGRVIFLRGLDVQTQGMRPPCKSVQVASRAQGSSYAATNSALGGAADCSK